MTMPWIYLLCERSQRQLRIIEYSIISLMALIAVTAIVWSFSIHLLTGDFYNGIIGAKLSFRERDFPRLDARSKRILSSDLEKLFNEIYSESNKTNKTAAELSVVPKESENVDMRNRTKTKRSEAPKAHIIRISSNMDVPKSDEDVPELEETTKTLFDVQKDRKFLESMTVDVYQMRGDQSVAVQFVYSFPFLSEMTAIIWAAMCLIFQSGVKKYWGLPKPWRIVVPSILIFAIMTIGSLVYTISANSYLKTFCTDIRANLTNPNVLSCGQAITVLRPAIRQHNMSQDVYLNLFRVSYVFSLICWLFALLIMLLRYFFAIDFQLVDMLHNSECAAHAAGVVKFTEVPLNSPKHLSDLQRVKEHQISEDDFQSAKSRLSEVAAPLLDNPLQNII